jgi:hypothetical protein
MSGNRTLVQLRRHKAVAWERWTTARQVAQAAARVEAAAWDDYYAAWLAVEAAHTEEEAI